MDRLKAREVLVGYMSPRNEAINIFAQGGLIEEGLLDEVEREIALAERELATINDRSSAHVPQSATRKGELEAMISELRLICNWVERGNQNHAQDIADAQDRDWRYDD